MNHKTFIKKGKKKTEVLTVAFLVFLAKIDQKPLAIMLKPLLQSQFASRVTVVLSELELHSREVISGCKHIIEGSGVLSSPGCPQSSV